MRIRRKKNLDIRLAALTDYIIPVDDTVKDARLVTRQKDYINLCDVFIITAVKNRSRLRKRRFYNRTCHAQSQRKFYRCRNDGQYYYDGG